MDPYSKKSLFGLALAAMISSVLLSCASTSGARPEDMSAKSHEEEAAKHEKKSERHEEQYDPNAPGPAYSEVVSGPDFAFEGGPTNPTDVHNDQAKKHQRHADAHRAAAAALQSAEQDACKSIATESRASCPFLGPVVATENTPDGVRITVREGTNMEEMMARIRCHIAFANTQRREGMDSCPLYVRGVQAEQSGPDSIDLSVKGKASVRELQKRVAHDIGP